MSSHFFGLEFGNEHQVVKYELDEKLSKKELLIEQE